MNFTMYETDRKFTSISANALYGLEKRNIKTCCVAMLVNLPSLLIQDTSSLQIRCLSLVLEEVILLAHFLSISIT